MAQQPNMNNVVNSMQNITAEVTSISQEMSRVPNLPAFLGAPAFAQMMTTLTGLQNSMTAVQADVANIRAILEDLLPMRLYNSSASINAPLRYPPNIADTTQLPRTQSDLMAFSAQQCQQAATVLGLPALPGGSTVHNRRVQIGNHLGVSI
ncbi:hypothetical protein ABW19_dt0201248 [Dactylella cylindrospora]|nr:hypothetical protein ABW19_dt0201248 [Dactylella cylindrospora]